MAKQALYTIQIPTHDNLGNHLGDLATAAHHWLWQKTGQQGSRIRRNTHGNWQDDPQETFDDLEVIGEDSPHMDSHIKQLAKHLNEAGNQWGMFVMKQGGGNVTSWVVDNPHYQEGAPAPVAQFAGTTPPQELLSQGTTTGAP